MPTPVDDRLLVRYLVGDCPEEERERVEERFFTDEETFDRLCELEEDLAWRYARGELNATEREQVERAYVAPPRRDRLILTIALGRVLAAAATPTVRAPARVIETPGWKRWLSLEPAGARFVLAVLSTPGTVYPNPQMRARYAASLGVESLFYPEQRLQALGAKQGFEVVALAPAMQRVADEKHEFLHGFPNTKPGFGHWNEAGHALAADLIAAELCSKP